MTEQSTPLIELNAVVAELVQKWMAIVNLRIELNFCYATIDPDAEPDPEYDTIDGYVISGMHFLGFGRAGLSNEGSIKVSKGFEPEECFISLMAPIYIELPNILQDIFRKHCTSDMFEANLNHIGLTSALHIEGSYYYSLWAHLSKVITQLQLDAFTETLIRPNAAALAAELKPFLPWFDYAAVVAERVVDATARKMLIADMNLLLCYLSRGGELNFAKMTSLCEVAGTLQPVRNLILTRMPQLAA